MSEARGTRGSSTVGLALAGGGPEGAIYELGALCAMDEAIEGLELHEVPVYVGVSAGSFVASCLANGITTAQLCRALVRKQDGDYRFEPNSFFRPAVREWFQRGMMTPRLTLEALWDYANHPDDLTLFESLTRVARALPVGIFDNNPIRQYLEQTFRHKGRTNDFRRLAADLFVVAADLDSGKAIRFGEPGRDHVPISLAVQASTALPGVYPPVLIEGRHYVDGVLLKTLHASVAMDAGVDLLFCVNPIVPVDTEDAVKAGEMRRGKLVHRGLPTVLSQTFRTLVHSRLSVGMASYAPRYPDVDVVLFEPHRDDYRMFFTNIFRFSSRKAVCDHAYQATRRDLLSRNQEISATLEKHGLRLRVEVLEERRDLWETLGVTTPEDAPPVTKDLDSALSRLEGLLGRMGTAG